MFYQYTEKLTEVAFGEADRSRLAVGFVSGEELANIAPALGISAGAVAACASMDRYFRSGVEVYDDYTYTQLRVSEPGGRHYCVAMFIKKDLIVLVDVEDPENTVRDKFMGVLGRYSAATVTAEKLLCAFFDSLIAGDWLLLVIE